LVLKGLIIIEVIKKSIVAKIDNTNAKKICSVITKSKIDCIVKIKFITKTNKKVTIKAINQNMKPTYLALSKMK
jgi:hypothetical protein